MTPKEELALADRMERAAEELLRLIHQLQENEQRQEQDADDKRR